MTKGKQAAPPSMLSRMGGGLMLLIVGLGCGAVIAVAPDIAAAIIVLQLPGAIACLLDSTPGKAIGRTILLFQAAASVRPIVSIWFQCDGLNACVAMATERHTYLTVILAAVGGFVLAQSLPIFVKLLDDGRVRTRRAGLVAERKKLTDEWGSAR